MSSHWGVGLLAVAACGRVGFGAAAGDGGGGSGSDLSGTCLDPGYGDSFDAEVFPCKMFGMVEAANVTMNESNGALTITPSANSDTNGGCTRASGAFGAAGTFVEISQVLPAPGQTRLSLTSTTGFFARVDLRNGMLAYSDSAGSSAMMTYEPTAHRWWRIRPAGGMVLAETSANGKSWTLFASATAAVPSDVSIAADVQTDDSNPSPGSAVFEGIDVCPP